MRFVSFWEKSVEFRWKYLNMIPEDLVESSGMDVAYMKMLRITLSSLASRKVKLAKYVMKAQLFVGSRRHL